MLLPLTSLPIAPVIWLAPPAQAQAAGALVHYIVLNADGTQAGALDIETGADGEQIARYRYKNNGRGPETVERWRLAADGTPLRYQVNGSSAACRWSPAAACTSRCWTG